MTVASRRPCGWARAPSPAPRPATPRASLAAYAAQAGLPAIVFVPAGKVASGKLAQTLAYGARCLQVRGDFDAAMRLVREACDRLGIYLVNSINPFRIEGQKTIVWELLQDLDWERAGLDRGARRQPRQHQRVRQGAARSARRRAGSTACRASPRSRRTAPTRSTAASRTGFAQPPPRRRRDGRHRHPHRRPGQPRPRRAPRSARRAASSTEVTDDEILAAKRDDRRHGHRLRARLGRPPWPASSKLAPRRRRSHAGERVVCVLTGHLLKDPEAAWRPEGLVEIEPTVEAVQARSPLLRPPSAVSPRLPPIT